MEFTIAQSHKCCRLCDKVNNLTPRYNARVILDIHCPVNDYEMVWISSNESECTDLDWLRAPLSSPLNGFQSQHNKQQSAWQDKDDVTLEENTRHSAHVNVVDLADLRQL